MAINSRVEKKFKEFVAKEVKDTVQGIASGVSDVSSFANTASNAVEEFVFESKIDTSKLFIPTSEGDIDALRSKYEGELSELNSNLDNINKLEQDYYDKLKENASKYGLALNGDGEVLTPDEYKENIRSALGNDNFESDPEYIKMMEEYEYNYELAMKECSLPNGLTIEELVNEKIVIEQEIKYNERKREELEYDSYILKDVFKNNFDFSSSYKDKMSNIELTLTINNTVVSTMEDAEGYYINNGNGDNVSGFVLLECLMKEKYGVSAESLRSLGKEEANELIDKLVFDGYNWAVDAYSKYKYMNDKQLALYKTICEVDGVLKARDYYKVIEEDINALQGLEDAHEFFLDILKGSGYSLEDINVRVNENNNLVVQVKNSNGEYVDNYELTTNLRNTLSSFYEGVGDGARGFLEGFINIFNTSDNRTRLDFKKMYVSMFLSDNRILKGGYDVGSGVGNMLPSVVTSAFTAFMGVPAAIQSNLGYMLLGISTYGNSLHGYRVEGVNEWKGQIGAVLNGALEYLTGKAFGRIPWLNEEANISILNYLKDNLSGNIFKDIDWLSLAGAFMDNMVHEGVEELLQTPFENGIDAVIKGENFDLAETTKESLYSFIMGAITAGIISGGNSVIDFTFNGVNYQINASKIKNNLLKGAVFIDDDFNPLLQANILESLQKKDLVHYLKSLSFGQFSKVFSYLEGNLQLELVEKYGIDAQIDSKIFSLNTFRNNNLKKLFKIFFGDKVSKEVIDGIGENIYFWSGERFKELRKLYNSNFLGFNDRTGSYLDLGVDTTTLAAITIHELIHSISLSNNASGFLLGGREVLRGINESCTQYMTLRMFQYLLGKNYYNPGSSYDTGVTVLSSMIDANIFILNDLVDAYLSNNVGYLVDTISSYGGNFSKIMEDFYIVTHGNSMEDVNNAKARLDNSIAKMVAFKLNGR